MWLSMLGLTALPHLGGLCGGFITRHEVKTWYPTLQKPWWRPPNAAFGIAWTCLYTGMGSVSYSSYYACNPISFTFCTHQFETSEVLLIKSSTHFELVSVTDMLPILCGKKLEVSLRMHYYPWDFIHCNLP